VVTSRAAEVSAERHEVRKRPDGGRTGADRAATSAGEHARSAAPAATMPVRRSKGASAPSHLLTLARLQNPAQFVEGPTNKNETRVTRLRGSRPRDAGRVVRVRARELPRLETCAAGKREKKADAEAN